METQTQTEFKSSQGQRAGALQLHFDELTKNEQLVVASLAIEGRPIRTINEIMEGLNWHKMRGGKARGCSRVRNTLRRLVRSAWVQHATEVGDGKYRLSKNALDRLRRLYAEPKKVQLALPAPKPEPVPAATITVVTLDTSPTGEPVIETIEVSKLSDVEEPVASLLASFALDEEF